MYLFEHLLMRLAVSSYADKFVLKGGLLISSMTGIYQRTTMDMDATVVGMSMDEATITKALREICATDVGDGMTFEFERIEPIREDDEYANWRAHLRALYGRIDAPVKVDITTGDAIYPTQIRHNFELMFDQGTLDVLSYHPATVLAEKLETVISRGEANTRGRDFYDLYAIPRYYSGSISEQDLREALRHTAEKRGSQQAIADWKDTLEGIRASAIMHQVWSSYIADAPYAKGTSFDDSLDSIERLMGSLRL
ncbi:abortive phage infection protein [Parvibacter caecicola]|uniref:Nucleotidyl transferase AbiEii/AbiGii toxin family protein n=2 Tax=Parvibacter caecicola TaxID=747645 RepID=A0A3N0ABJ5_9ACTN|nr:abortive phage infection protein [Parvibacter caecicola]TJW11552.1 nucleotidyl transferase AbiEii/AbiGii toxin family protein [Parvibacter caecicola]